MKPNTFTKLYAHCVFTPKGREFIMRYPIMEKIQKYIYGTIKEKKCVPIAINGMPDHIHLLFRFNPDTTISAIMRDIKRSSSIYINTNKLFGNRFMWQEGYGAFTVGYRELDIVYKYIVNQQVHHSNIKFREEYMQMLEEEGFENNRDYLFEFYD
jgi:REP element-mobilizing transposase RayT